MGRDRDDGEQRRDNYASFVATRLDNCQLIPVTDLLPYVTDPDQFAEILVKAVRMKPTGHHLLEGRSTHDRSMYQIGG